MKKTSLIGFLIFIVLFFIAPFFVLAAPVGKITRIEGRVDVLKAGQRSVTPVSLGNAVDVGDIYRTKTEGRAEITFFNKNILRIAPATRVQVSQYSDEGNRSNQIMKLERGKVEAVSGEEFIKKVSSFAEGNKFEVHTPNAVAGIRGSGMTTGFAQMVTGLFFSTGRGYFYNPTAPGRVVNVTAGFMSFIVGTGGMPTPPVRGNIAYIGGGGANFGTGGTGGGAGNTLLTQNTVLDSTYVFTQQRVDIPTASQPSVFVGSIPLLSGFYSGMGFIDVALNNVKFYGPSTTAAPQSWQAGSVTGNYDSAYPYVGRNIPLSGSSNSAVFTITSQTGGSYSATVTNGSAPGGVGSYTQTVTFTGTSSGTYGVTSLSGTASGTAK